MSYPHETTWQPLTSFATYGTYRSGERRYLQNAMGFAWLFLLGRRLRVLPGAAAMGMGTYDSADTRQFAFGAGPALVVRTWLGGDFYRAYDGILTAQIGYLFPLRGESPPRRPQRDNRHFLLTACMSGSGAARAGPPPDTFRDHPYFKAATAREIVTTTEWKYAAASSE